MPYRRFLFLCLVVLCAVALAGCFGGRRRGSGGGGGGFPTVDGGGGGGGTASCADICADAMRCLGEVSDTCVSDCSSASADDRACAAAALDTCDIMALAACGESGGGGSDAGTPGGEIGTPCSCPDATTTTTCASPACAAAMLCLSFSGEGICTDRCVSDADCPSGYYCYDSGVGYFCS